MIRLCLSVVYPPFIYIIAILISLSYNDVYKCVAWPGFWKNEEITPKIVKGWVLIQFRITFK